MRTIRRVGGLAVAGLLVTSFVSGPAAAQQGSGTPEVYAGSAAGQALVLTVAGTGVSAGLSKATGNSNQTATAEGQGSLLLGQLGALPIGTSKPATASQTGEGNNGPFKNCAADPITGTPLATLLTVGIACGTANAAVTGGNPNGLATGSVFDLDVTANTLLNTAIGPVQPALAPVLGTLDTINKTVDNLDGPGNTVPDLKVDDTVTDLLNRLRSVKTLEVRIGSSQSQVVAVDGSVTAQATAEGGIISLLPVELPLANGTIVTKPLVEIVIGSAKATAVYDRASGTATPSFDPSIVTIRINTPTTDALSGKVLGINFQEIQIDPSLSPAALPAATAAVVSKCADAENEFCVLPGTPLETRIAVASGRSRTNADGSVTAISDAVKIHALKNIGTLVAALNGGILLQLAHAEATVGGSPVKAAIETPRELPRTGGSPFMPILGLAGLALAVITRRTLVRSHQS